MDRRITIPQIFKMKREREKIVALTAYDATFAGALDRAGVDVALIGDSLGMVIQGHATTLPVTVDDMVYHCRCVSRGSQRCLLIADMPFMSYPNGDRAADHAARLVQEGGAQMVKIEGGASRAEIVRFLVEQNIPVCGHLGLLPQSIHRLGRYSVQAKDQASAATLRNDALILQDAGISALVLECVPSELSKVISAELEIPVIGIGAGPYCDGQVLVLHDLLGLQREPPARFVKNFLQGASGIEDAIRRYAGDVRSGVFPAPAHCY